MRRIVLPLLAGALDLLWPPLCLVCTAPAWGGGVLCELCAARLPLPGPRCRRCGRPRGPFGTEAPCGRCREERWRLDGMVVGWAYRGVARDLVLALKFGGRLEAASLLAARLAEAVREARIPGDLVVPVPLSGRRRRRRGYDQAAVIARGVSRALGLEAKDRALRRRRHTPPQAQQPPGRRRRSPRGAFCARRPLLEGRCVLLVDDVLTTGATAEACATALRRAGARSVVAAVACRS